jgi:hypothetical protein
MTEKDTEFGFEVTKEMPVADRGDIKTEKMIQKSTDTVMKEKIDSAVRGDLGAEKPRKGGMTKDVPQMVFRVAGSLIGCKKFELSDEEADQMATHLNILIPVEGKMVSVVFILLITLNKVYGCLDQIKAKFGAVPDDLQAGQQKPNLPEQMA